MSSSIKSVSQLESTVAILIDAENTPYGLVGEIMETSARFGRTIIRRAYGDWGTQILSSWRQIFSEYPISAIQQFHYVAGKNSSDSAMMIDAMDILRERRVDTFVLVTSDSDFTKLATRIREDGLKVIGIGSAVATKSFVKACDEFVLIENLRPSLSTPAKSTRKSNISRVSQASSEQSSVSSNEDIVKKGKELLLKAVTVSVDENGRINGGLIGIILRRLDPTFTLQQYGVSKLTDFIGLFPDVIVATGEKGGGLDPIYKLVDSQLNTN